MEIDQLNIQLLFSVIKLHNVKQKPGILTLPNNSAFIGIHRIDDWEKATYSKFNKWTGERRMA